MSDNPNPPHFSTTLTIVVTAETLVDGLETFRAAINNPPVETDDSRVLKLNAETVRTVLRQVADSYPDDPE